MDATKFEAIVTARADERVQQRIAAFKRACWVAALNLRVEPVRPLSIPNPFSDKDRAFFALLAEDSHQRSWPGKLWRDEEAAVREEILATLDELQRAFLAADRQLPGENAEEAVDLEET